MNLQENIYDKIKEMFGELNDNLSVIEDQIDVDLQMEYFEYSKNLLPRLSSKEIIDKKDNIFEKNIPLEDKKNLLVQLASVDSIEAYRTIEKYLEKPNQSLNDWARLAFYESRMLLESKILDENQILISTGLGGKGFKLRYFTAFFTNQGKNLTKLQEKLIQSETEYIFRKHNAEVEFVDYDNNVATVLSMIPLNVPIQKLFSKIIDNCNVFGNFLDKNYIITNVKILSFSEIQEYIANYSMDIISRE